MAELLTLRDEGYAVAKEEGVEALPYLVSGDGSDPGPGLTTLRLIQYHLKTAIEDWKRVGNGTLQQEERTTKVEDRLVASPESDSVADTTDLPSSPFPSARWFRCCMVAIHHAPSFQCTSAALLLLGLALALKRWVAAWLSPNVPRTAGTDSDSLRNGNGGMPSQGKLGPTYVSVAARERTTQSRQVLATAFQTGPREASHGSTARVFLANLSNVPTIDIYAPASSDCLPSLAAAPHKALTK
ncbi:unnamed protein product [Dovyalis caffra]|uniref:Uncharacterized protein n=1 Tax=Dovyalis caffra TaxID=77055 RepID=A0AAV1R8F5_9ROSI|nr:unnamed protein product [Dovyalis caffra]